MLNNHLEVEDPEIYNLIETERKRQNESISLIASENFTSVSVLEANGSILTNKYSSGLVGNRYYNGNKFIDQVETICKQRALQLFNLDPEIWDVNVQLLSGSISNMSVYLGLIGKSGKILGLNLADGGHLTHGFKTKKKKISSSSIFFESLQYGADENGFIDYNDIEKKVSEFKPDIIIAGGSAYPRDFDYERLRDIAGKRYLMMDMAHISGFIATGLMKNAFEYCDVVTTTTHKILRGPRSGMIFYRKIKKQENGNEVDVSKLIENAVFPGMQGGPHNNKISALAVALKQANTKEYKEYIKDVHDNCLVMCEEMMNLGYKLTTGGSDCHLALIYLNGVGSNEVSWLCNFVNIILNKNCVPGDKSPASPSGIRIGTPAMTTRGFKANDFKDISLVLHEAILLTKKLCLEIEEKEEYSFEKFKNSVVNSKEVDDLLKRVIKIATRHDPVPYLESK